MNIHGYEIPDGIIGTAIGALIGASVSFINTYVNDRRTTSRLVLQNAHSEKLASDAREHTMRKEILLSLPDAMHKFQSEFGGLPWASSLDAIQREFLAFSTVLSKVSVVASTNTAALATELSAFFSTAYLASLPTWAKVNDLRTTFETSVKKMSDVNARITAHELELAEALKNAADGPGNIPDLLTNRQRRVELERTERDGRLTEMNMAMKSYLDASDDFTRDIIAVVENSDQHTIAMLIAVRSELGIETDEDLLRKVFGEQKAVMLKSLKTTTEEARKIAEREA